MVSARQSAPFAVSVVACTLNSEIMVVCTRHNITYMYVHVHVDVSVTTSPTCMYKYMYVCMYNTSHSAVYFYNVVLAVRALLPGSTCFLTWQSVLSYLAVRTFLPGSPCFLTWQSVLSGTLYVERDEVRAKTMWRLLRKQVLRHLTNNVTAENTCCFGVFCFGIKQALNCPFFQYQLQDQVSNSQV